MESNQNQTLVIQYPYPKRRPFFNFVLKIGRLIKKRPIVLNRNEAFEKQAIFISNHSGASGPMNLALFFPSFFIPWGASPMVGNYFSRWKYLYYVFYQQKLGYKKVRSYFIATFFALISKRLYKGMDLIPTYEDLRLVKTFRLSENFLLDNKPIFIFPEDSSKGYLDHILQYHEGFLAFSEYFFQKHGIDLPIYTVGFSKKHNKMIIEKPITLQKLYAQGMDRHQAAQHFKDLTNALVAEIKTGK